MTESREHLPVIIQGGMGVAVSGWRMAKAVATLGHLGVVSGTALDVVHARRLENGDPDGDLRRAYAAFPVPGVADRVLDRWFVQGGRAGGAPYRRVPRSALVPPVELEELTIVANFAEVWLAKEGHDGRVGVNYLEKVQLPTPLALYGALLGGVDYILMGAGIPSAVPRLLDALVGGQAVSYRVSVEGGSRDVEHAVSFDPAVFAAGEPVVLRRPMFLAIVASNTLATFLARDPETRPDGFVVEGPVAGGHNAPPRGPRQLDAAGEPIYGRRDVVDLEQLAALGLPFWLAGGYGSPEGLREARRLGAEGVQVGTAFALCVESALDPALRRAVIDDARAGTLRVRTDPLASPSGYPFKVADVAGTLSEAGVAAGRRRICDLGFLRTAYLRPDGSVGFRCPSEPVADYVRKGGRREDTEGRKCLCNALLATVALGQRRRNGTEPALVTLGDDAVRVVHALASTNADWDAAAVVTYLLSEP